MAIRIRKDGRMLCAALHGAEPGDTYLDNDLHYRLSVDKGVLVTETSEKHSERGEWWWRNAVPKGIKVDSFYTARRQAEGGE